MFKTPIFRTLAKAFMVCMAPSLLVFILIATNEYKRDVQSAELFGISAASSLSIVQKRLTLSANVLLSTLANSNEFKELDTVEISNTFKRILTIYPDYSNFHIIKPNGDVFSSASEIPSGGVNLSDRKHVQDALRTREFSIGEFVVSRLTFDQVLPFSHPVFDDKGSVIAVVIAVLRLSSYGKFLSESELPKNSSIILYDHKYKILFKYPPSVTGIDAGSPETSFIDQHARQNFHLTRIDSDGIERSYCTKGVYENETSPPYLYISVGIPAGAALKKSLVTIAFWIVLSLFVLVASLALSWAMIRNTLASNCKKIYDSALNFMNGNLDARTCLTAQNGEIGVVGEAFDAMACKIQEGILDLREKEERFRTLIEQAPEAILVTDVESGAIQFVNENAENLFACSKDNLQSNGILRFYSATQPDGRPPAESIKDYRKRALSGETVIVERMIKDASDKEHICEVRIVKFPSAEGKLIRSSWLDISQRKLTENAIQISEHQFRSVIQSLPIGMLFFDIIHDDRIVFDSANPAAEHLLNFDSNNLNNQLITDIFPSLMSHEMTSSISKLSLELQYHSPRNFLWKTCISMERTIYTYSCPRKRHFLS